MIPASESVHAFFKDLETNGNTLHIEGLSAQYGDVFGFADAEGLKMVKKEEFLKVLPQRKQFVDSIGLKFSRFLSLQEENLDENYLLVQAVVLMHFEKDGKSIDDQDSTTYILRKKGNSFEIVFHLESRGLMKKVKELQLL